jgi:RecJ-like exonuclease
MLSLISILINGVTREALCKVKLVPCDYCLGKGVFGGGDKCPCCYGMSAVVGYDLDSLTLEQRKGYVAWENAQHRDNEAPWGESRSGI